MSKDPLSMERHESRLHLLGPGFELVEEKYDRSKSKEERLDSKPRGQQDSFRMKQ